jgi:hypothetical protein
MAGNVNFGYEGDLGSAAGGSDHGMGMGGSGSLHGNYYNPSFLSFDITPYYDRAMSSAGSSSTTDSSGYNAMFSVFGGSHDPGSVSFGQNWNTVGQFGIPGVGGLTSKSNSRSLAVSWGLLFPFLPPISVSYAQSSGSNSVLGSDAATTSSQRTYGLSTSYRFHGFNVGGSFNRLDSTATAAGSLINGGGETSTGGSNMYSLTLTRSALPLGGSFSANWSRTDYKDNSDGGSSDGTTQNLSASGGFRLWRLPISASAAYTENVYGSIDQQLLSNGSTVLVASNSPETSTLLVNVGTSYRLPFGIFSSVYLSRQEEYFAGGTYGVTQFGANVNYNFNKRYTGLSVMIGMNDSAAKQGNLGAGLISSVNYNRRFGPWHIDGNYTYNQNVQTMLALYTASNMGYGASAGRKLTRSLNWNASFGGGHSGFSQQAGSSNHSETYTSNINWHSYTMSGNYSQSSGVSLLTPNGLITTSVPTPIISGSSLVVFNGKGEGVGFGGSPIRRLSVSGSFSVTTSTGLSSSSNSESKTEVTSGYCTYLFRKVFFNAGVTRFSQSVGGSGLPINTTSYYIGISRSMKVF